MRVAIVKDERIDYCRESPFHPEEVYPENPFGQVSRGNACYGAVRELLRLMGMDGEHYGRASWNPLGEIIKPGDHVLIKPNFVRHYNKAGGVEPLITHGSVIRAMLDYACIAMEGSGRITIADSPYLDADFDSIVKLSGIDRITDFYKEQGITVHVADLRRYRGMVRPIGGMERETLAGDPLGYTTVDLKDDSDHYEIIDDCERFRNGYYDRREMLKHHNREHNEYCIANSVLDADVILNLPKMKTHSKAGMTCALKNAVGINGLKDWLPHHRAGPSEAGGDDYACSDFRKNLLAKLRDEQVITDNLLYIMPLRAISALLLLSKKAVPFRDRFEAGGWHGNDTIPRTISDLNRILFHADEKGRMIGSPQRKMFVLVDGIVAGHKEGPLIPEPAKCGVLVAGHNPVAVDLVCTRIMGFDHAKMPVFRHTMSAHKYSIYDGMPTGIEIASGSCSTFDGVYDAFNCRLEPAAGWKGFIEYESCGQEIAGSANLTTPYAGVSLLRH